MVAACLPSLRVLLKKSWRSGQGTSQDPKSTGYSGMFSSKGTKKSKDIELMQSTVATDKWGSETELRSPSEGHSFPVTARV